MNPKCRKYLWFIILNVLINMSISCQLENNSDSINDPQSKRKIIAKDSTLMEQIKGLEMAIREELEFRLGMEPLENGFDGLQVRLHKTHDEMGTDEQFIVLTDSNSHWSARLVEFYQIYSKAGDSVGIVIKKLTNKAPHSSWKKLMDSLTSLNILDLPDFESLSNYNVPTDGGQIKVEWVKGDKYGRYSYYAPDLNARTIAEARKIVEIASLIEYEFDFKNFGYRYK